jgi:ferrous iron transport protein B
MNNKLKILLIGQPNVGKSSLLNSLVGPRVEISNYPGTTVELTEAKKVFRNTEINFVDTPGIYSISDRSQEEKVTEKSLFESDADGTVVIIDTTSLERGLYLVLQILEAKTSMVIALNFLEEAQQKGVKVDYKKLSRLLKVPVVPINAVTGKGINKLLNKIFRIKSNQETFEVEYDDHIEQAIDKVSSEVESDLSSRFVAIRALEGDQHFYKYLQDKKIIKKTKQDLEEHPELAKDISVTRYGTASFVAEKVTKLSPLEKGKEFEEKIDHFLLHKIWGPIITGLSLLLIFGILLKLGNLTQSFLMGWTENLTANLGNDSLLSLILTQGLIGLTTGVSIALPYILLFYLLLGLLEDMGVLSRFIVNTERILKKIGLPGKSFVPLILGLGCTVPAIKATRILSSKKEQFHAASMLAFVPCSSRIAIIMGIVGFYGGVGLALLVFITLITSGLVWALIIKKILSTEENPLLLELPLYRRPLVKNILVKAWIRMKDFVYIVIPLLMVGGMAYGALDLFEITDSIIEPLSFIPQWLRLPQETVIPLVFGFLQKDLTGTMLISVLRNNISSALSSLQLYIFGLASTIGIPCVIAWGMLWKEFGFKRSFGLTVSSIVYGFLITGLIARVVSLIL